MQISINGKHIDVGDALRTHVQETIKALVSKYFDHPIEAAVVFSREAHNFRADVSAHPTRGVLVQGGAAAGDAYAAFDAAAERVSTQLRRYKQRLNKHKGKSDVAATIPAQYHILAASGSEEVSAEEHQPIIIAEMTADVPVCTVSGAVMRLDLAGTPAIMFRNSAHGGLNLVYRRPDGNIGWIDPQKTGADGA